LIPPLGSACPPIGAKGERLHDWAYLELTDLEADEFRSSALGLWTRGLLMRRRITGGELAYSSTWCLAGTPIETLVAVEGHRWAIEDSFGIAKNELGPTHNETCSWHRWQRHVSLVMPAFAMMAVIRHHANLADEQILTGVSLDRGHSSAGPSRTSAA
jgi:SRSO17 transposase